MENKIESIFGIDIFEWKDWEEMDDDWLQFYDVSFCLESMKKYDGLTVSLNRNGHLEVYNDESKVILSDYIIKVPEFKNQLIDMQCE